MKSKHLILLLASSHAISANAETCYFDNLGRLKKSQTSENIWKEYKYDQDTQNLILETSYYTEYGKPTIQKTSYKYDKKGNLIEKINDDKEDGYKTIYSYDDNGNLLSEGSLYVYKYDADGRKISVENNFYTDESKNTITKYTYDSNGRKVAETTYDKSGKQTSKFTNTYDTNGNRIGATMVFPDDTTTWTFIYNNKNQRVAMSNSNGDKASYKYDKNDCLVEEIQETDGNKATITYSYDDNGNLLSTQRNGYAGNTFVWDNPNWKSKVAKSDWYDWLKHNKYSNCDPRPFTEKEEF